jgi:small subunit ribosomal protein S16
VAVALRLTRLGKKKRPFYRIVAIDREFRRDGRYIEKLGNYDPLSEPPAVHLSEERVKYWLSVGAQPSNRVRDIIVKHIPGVVEARQQAQTKRIQAQRKKRKERAAAAR